MFSKRPPPGALGERIRRVAERSPPTAHDFRPTRKPAERADRRPLYREGFLVFESGQKMRVAIKNLSDSGARIEFFSRADLPDHVWLSEPILKLRRRARVVWQRDHTAGLFFMDER